MKVQIGCGNDRKKGYINLDSSRKVTPDIVWNLEKVPLPFKDNSIEEIIANHVLEHIFNFVPLIHDLWRIGKNNAKIKIKVPFFSSWGQFNDPTHVRFFTPFTFNYFERNNYSHEVGTDKTMFKIKRVKINFSVGKAKFLNFLINPLINLNKKFYCRFMAWIIPASELEFELIVLK
jgi:hypothetical protein